MSNCIVEIKCDTSEEERETERQLPILLYSLLEYKMYFAFWPHFPMHNLKKLDKPIEDETQLPAKN